MPDLDQAGAVIPLPTQVRGRTIFGYDPGAAALIPVQVTAAGAVVTSGGGGPPTPGSTVGPTPADTAVGIGATVALPAPPATPLSQIVQNTGGAGTLVRIREVGGPAGSGILLPPFSIFVFDKAVAALEAENVGGVATTVMVTWERT